MTGAGGCTKSTFPLAELSGGWDAEPSARVRTPLPAPCTQGGGLGEVAEPGGCCPVPSAHLTSLSRCPQL